MAVSWFVLGLAIFVAIVAIALRLAARRANAGDGGPMIGVRHAGSHPFLTSSDRRVEDDGGDGHPPSDDA
jgi:hypothetical protein